MSSKSRSTTLFTTRYSLLTFLNKRGFLRRPLPRPCDRRLASVYRAESVAGDDEPRGEFERRAATHGGAALHRRRIDFVLDYRRVDGVTAF